MQESRQTFILDGGTITFFACTYIGNKITMNQEGLMLLSFFFLLGFGLGRTTGRFIKTTDELHTKDGDLGEE